MPAPPDTRGRLGALLVPGRGEAWLAAARQACARAQVEAWEWLGGSLAGPPPGVLVAGLGEGERRIPEAVLGLLERLEGEVPLLLLCEEDLARPSLALQGGRVTLLGPPLTEARIAARLRVLLAGPGVPRPAPPGAALRELASRHAYLGLAGAGGDGGPSLPLLDQAPDRALTAVLGLSQEVEAALGPRALEVCRRDQRDEQREQALSAALGGSAGLVHLSAAREWVVHWPDPRAALLLFSPQRLPPAYSLAAALGRLQASSVHLPAATADVLLAVWGEPLPTAPARLAEAAADGGPALLDLVGEALAARTTPSQALVVEVR